ncbi:MAG: hypothetical protein IJ829_06705, partial [Kiritimatiellae bacterium]|nr:hypothetical protein [Kiritimatiellia bacterium]
MKRKRERQTPEQKAMRDFAEMVYSHTDAHNPYALAKRVCTLCPGVYKRFLYLYDPLRVFTPSCAFESKDVQRRILHDFAVVLKRANKNMSMRRAASAIWELCPKGYKT